MLRGCTFLSGRGPTPVKTGTSFGFRNITQQRTYKDIGFQITPKAFITISEATEFFGSGFKVSGTEF
jgi:hypothetical protein